MLGTYQKFLIVLAKEIIVDIIVPKLMYAAHHCVVSNATIIIQLIAIDVVNILYSSVFCYIFTIN